MLGKGLLCCPPHPFRVSQQENMLYLFSSYTLFPNIFSSLVAESMDVELTDPEAGSITGKMPKLCVPSIFH